MSTSAAASRKEMRRFRCVTYMDAFSADKCSYNDMMIGVEHRVVGCGGTNFNKMTGGDYVIIVANKGKKTFFTIGCLKDRLETCKRWHDAGGRMWNHNFTYEPLTGVIERNTQMQRRINKICASFGVESTWLFNSRLCSEKRYLSVVEALVEYLQTHEAVKAASMDQLEGAGESE